MTARRHLGTLASALLILAVAGCALPVQVSEPPAEPRLSERKTKAVALSRKGDLAAALVEWRVLETLSGGDAEVTRERRKLETEISRRTAADFAKGRKAASKGRLKQARRSFLAVLKADPNHGAAIEELRKIEVLRVRQRRPNYVGYQAARAAAAKPVRPPDPPAATQSAPSPPSPPKSEVKEAAALAAQGDHDRAIALLETHLQRHPEDREARARLSSSHAAVGVALFKAGKLEQSLAHLEKSAGGEGRDPQVTRMLADAKGKLAQDAYEKGVRVFRQDVDKAIAYWEKTLAYDPAHTKAKLHLERAYRIQATLKSIKP